MIDFFLAEAQRGWAALPRYTAALSQREGWSPCVTVSNSFQLLHVDANNPSSVHPDRFIRLIQGSKGLEEPSFNSWENLSSERLSNLPQVTQPISGEPHSGARSAGFPIPTQSAAQFHHICNGGVGGVGQLGSMIPRGLEALPLSPQVLLFPPPLHGLHHGGGLSGLPEPTAPMQGPGGHLRGALPQLRSRAPAAALLPADLHVHAGALPAGRTGLHGGCAAGQGAGNSPVLQSPLASSRWAPPQ